MLTAPEAGEATPNLLLGVGAALHYSNAEDAQSVELQKKIAELGLEGAIKEVTGISNDALVAEIIKAYNEIE